MQSSVGTASGTTGSGRGGPTRDNAMANGKNQRRDNNNNNRGGNNNNNNKNQKKKKGDGAIDNILKEQKAISLLIEQKKASEVEYLRRLEETKLIADENKKLYE